LDCTTNLFEVLNKFSLNVWPNPFENEIQIEFDGHSETELLLLRPSGEFVKHQFLFGGSIDLKDLPIGIYFLGVRTGNYLSWEKIVKSN